MRYLEREISKGRNLEEAIPKFVVKLMDVYNRYSYVRFSMNYYTFYEILEDYGEKDNTLSSLYDTFQGIVEAMLHHPGEEELRKELEQTEKLRNRITELMTSLTNCVDIFNIYEYCLNRVEYNYKDGSEFLHGADEELTRDVLQYILQDRDQVVINGKISEVLRQLPIRMTKGHFFELLKEGIKVYRESEKGSVDDFIYMIRTVSMLDISENTFALFQDVEGIYKEFADTDFSALDEEKYNNLSAKLQYAVNEIQKNVDLYMMFADVVNDLYVILLSSLHLMGKDREDQKDEDTCLVLIQKEQELYQGVSYEDVYETLEDGFLYLEGKQEKYSETFQKFGYLIDLIQESYPDVIRQLSMEEVFHAFERISKLVSGSIFVEFEEHPEKREIAGMKYINQKYQALEQELDTFFQNHPKNVNRAVMAHILSELPIAFGSVEELKDYILNALSGCRNQAEKAAAVQILTSMQQE